MKMPETAVNKNHGPVFRKHDVRLSGKGLVQRTFHSESVSHPVKEGPDPELWLGIPSADPAHVPGSLFFCQFVSHDILKGMKKQVDELSPCTVM